MNTTFITLWYLGTPYTYTPQHFIDGVWRPDWYACVYSCPVIEMLSKDNPDLAEELLRMVSASDWVKQFKRPMRLGDRFTLGDVNWVFAKTVDIPTFMSAGLTTMQLPAWKDTSILQVPNAI